jgi:hypothetical protein
MDIDMRMGMDVLHGHKHASWIRACSMDMDMQHVLEDAAWTWAWACSMDVDIDMQH